MEQGRTRSRQVWALAILPLVVSQPELGRAAGLRDLPLNRFVDATSLEALADMVITDTKVAQSPDTVTQRIVVLRGDDIQSQPDANRNLAELLRYTSGQFVNVLSRNDANWGAYAGLGPKYNSYLLDGLPFDSFVDAMSLDPAVIDRIEVHKGPASVLYSNYLTMDFAGNEAPLAGTTNFVLRNRVEAPLTRVSVGAGSWDTQFGRAYRQGRAGGLSYFVGLGAERSDYAQYGEPGSWLQTVEAPDYTKTRFYGNLNYELGRPDHSMSLFAHHTRHDGDMGRPNRDIRHRYDTLNFTYDNRFSEDWHVQFKAGERGYDRRFGNDDYPAGLALVSRDDTRQTIRPMDLTLSHLHGGNGLLTLGVDSQWMEYSTRKRDVSGTVLPENEASARSTGLFVQDKVQWHDWVLRAGLRHNAIRHDYQRLGGNVPATDHASWRKNLWSLGARYNAAPELYLYANAGTSFMVPSAKQIGGTVSSPAASGHLPNPRLKPENGVGRDFGLVWQPTPAFDIGVRAFLNTIEDAVVDNAVGATQAISINAGEARAEGLEVDIRHVASDRLTWFANLTHTRTRVDNPLDPDQDGTAVPFAPDTVANAGLIARLPWQSTASLYYHWVGAYYDSTSRAGRQRFGEHGTLNARFRQTWRPGLDLVVDLNNLGDRRHRMPWGFRDPGFNGLASLEVTF